MALREKITDGFMNWRYVIWVLPFFYFANLIFSWVPGQLSRSYLNKYFSDKSFPDNSIDRFDWTIMTDMWIHHGEGLSVVLSAIVITGLLYFFVHSFLLTGLASQIIQDKPQRSRSEFLKLSAKSYFKIIRLEVYMLLIYASIFLLANVYFMKKGLNPFELESDHEFIANFLLSNGLAFLLCFFIRIWHLVSKFIVVRDDSKLIHKSMLSGLKQSWRSIRSLVGVQLFFLLIFGILFLFSIKLFDGMSMDQSFKQWIYILLVQFVIIIKISFRIIQHWVIGKISIA